MRQVYDEGPKGLAFRTPTAVDAAVAASMFTDHPNYGQIQAPALAIYSDYATADQVPPGASAAQRQAGDAFSRAVIQPWQAVEKARFRLQARCGQMIQLHRTGHSSVHRAPAPETAEWINSYLESENPCTWSASG